MKRIAIFMMMILLLLTACHKSYPEHLTEAQIDDLREEYPYDNGMDPLIDIRRPELAAYVDIAPAYVVGQVVETGYTDWAGSWRYYPLKVQIHEIVYDKELDLENGDIITVRIPDYEYEYNVVEYPNDYTLVMPIWPHEEEYSSSRFGWYYVTDDEYVLSMISKGDLDHYSGWSLDEFSDALKAMKK